MDERQGLFWRMRSNKKAKTGRFCEKNIIGRFNALFCTQLERYGSHIGKSIAGDSRYVMHLCVEAIAASIQKQHGKIAKSGLNR